MTKCGRRLAACSVERLARGLAGGVGLYAAAVLVTTAGSAPAHADGSEVVTATAVRTVKLRHGGWVRTRAAAKAPRFGMVKGGTRLAVRGQVISPVDDGCRGRLWYAVQPMGFVCGRDAEPTNEAPGGEPALTLRPGRRVPYSYAIVREQSLSGFRSADEARAGTVAKAFEKGMMIAVRGTTAVDGVRYVRTWDRFLVRAEGVRGMGAGSTWVGESLAADARLPFGWTVPVKARRWDDPEGRPADDRVPRRTRVQVLEERGDTVRTDRGWLRAADVAVVRRIAPPPGVDARGRWIDVDVGEQVLVAYEGARPVYATLVSTGSGSGARRTPLGNYPVWAKVASIDMDNQEGEAAVYTVQRVPWVLFFQEHNAVHGAYWHDRFGQRASHGCVNLAPRDAQTIFDWAMPPLLPGWESFMPDDLARSIVIHVRDSTRVPSFEQQAPIGPPRD
jgi:hypothetical protein